jgi:hypothetical protein
VLRHCHPAGSLSSLISRLDCGPPRCPDPTRREVHATQQVYFGPLTLGLRTENTVSANAGN